MAYGDEPIGPPGPEQDTRYLVRRLLYAFRDATLMRGEGVK